MNKITSLTETTIDEVLNVYYRLTTRVYDSNQELIFEQNQRFSLIPNSSLENPEIPQLVKSICMTVWGNNATS